jgi:hypothetical protein
MKYGSEYDKRMLRVCGHGDAYSFAYTNQKQRLQQELQAGRTLCEDCKAEIRKVLDPCALGQVCDPLSFSRTQRLPELLGTPSQVEFGLAVRARLASKLFCVMAVSEQSNTALPKAVHYAIRLLFSIQSSRYWLDHRDEFWTAAWLIRECEILLRTTDTLCGPLPDASPYAYWVKKDQRVATSARTNSRASAKSARSPGVHTANVPQLRDKLAISANI